PEQRTPRNRRQKTMGIRITLEIERRERGDAGRDTDFLDTENQKNRPYQIEKGGRRDQRAERGPWHELLRAECYRIVSDEHWLPPAKGPPYTPVPAKPNEVHSRN